MKVKEWIDFNFPDKRFGKMNVGEIILDVQRNGSFKKDARIFITKIKHEDAKIMFGEYTVILADLVQRMVEEEMPEGIIQVGPKETYARTYIRLLICEADLIEPEKSETSSGVDGHEYIYSYGGGQNDPCRRSCQFSLS